MTAEFKILATLLSATVISFPSAAQQRGFALGSSWSTRECGLSASLSPGSDIVNELSLCADLWDVLDGDVGSPGVIASYDMCYTIRSWANPDCGISLYLGPGFCAGWVMDRDKEWGWMAGMDILLGICARFRVPIDLSFGFKVVLGLHANVNDSHNSTLTFYKNGWQRACQPELRLRYRFK